MSPPRLPSRHLVEVGQLFGIPEGTVRVALTRMTQAGELISDQGRYELAGALRDRYERQLQSRSPRSDHWSGDWSLLVVRASPRDATSRAELRDAARLLRFGQLHAGVWTRPDNLSVDGASTHWRTVDRQCRTMLARPEDPAQLAAEIFNLGGWAGEASRLLDEMAPFVPRLRAGDETALRDAFVVAASVVRHLLADPLLPVELAPVDFPADDLRSEYDAYEAAFQALWRDFFAGR